MVATRPRDRNAGVLGTVAAMDTAALAFLIAGTALLAAAALPRLTADRPVSAPLLAVALGAALFALPLPLPSPDPLEQGPLTERLTEVTVIVALAGTGLKLDRRLGGGRWRTPIRLLAIAMPLFIAVVAVTGSVALGLGPAAALLLGAMLAPTDPVLATEVQVGPPVADEQEQEGEDEVRFGLTSEAGLNDGLAFPFTNAAVAISAAGLAPARWLGEWLLVDVLREIAVGVGVGVLTGRVLAQLLLRTGRAPLAQSRDGILGLACTLLGYGVAELAGGYGFLAVFVGALTFRRSERSHAFHDVLHEFVDQAERGLTMVLLVLFGGALVGGLLSPLGAAEWAVVLLVVLVVRPLTAGVSLVGIPAPRRELAAIAFFGVRGIGSFYYLAHALELGVFTSVDGARLWGIVGAVVLVSIVVHGVTAAPVLGRLDRRREVDGSFRT